MTIIAWKRYVDDTMAAVKKGDEEALLQELNSHHECIKFSMDIEREGSIDFLDISVQRQPNGLKTTVFRKNTSSDRYLDSSCNSGSVK